MMDLMQNLWQMGGQEAAQAAPTSMEQIKVPQQAMDLAGTVDAANSQLDFNAAQPGTDWSGIAKQGLLAIGQSMGGGGQKQEPMIQAPQYRGGRAPEAFKAEDFSNMNQAGLMGFAQVPGLMKR